MLSCDTVIRTFSQINVNQLLPCVLWLRTVIDCAKYNTVMRPKSFGERRA